AAAAVAKRLGNMRSTAIGLSLSAVFFLLMPLSPSFGLLSLFYVLRMGTRFMSDPIITSAFLKSVPEDEQSTANSIRMIAMNGGGAVSPLIGGSLMDNVSLDSPAYIGAGLTFVMAALYPLLLRKELDES
ncbi:MFS transporter, partial [Candidatus Bathyarchaeota archaeon]|nr:MFS transporter [Candidatus Bathyarchaeota archaeon]